MAELTWQKAIQQVLAASAGPLHYKEITERILADGLRENIGAIPVATVSAQITQSIKKEGSQSPYVRVAKGTYVLAVKYTESTANAQAAPAVQAVDTASDDLIR